MITGVDIEKWWDKHYPWWPLPTFPPEYRSGIGEEGVEALKEFVEQGGTLICFDGASELAINRFKLKMRNVLEGVDAKEFFCPGSTLRACVDNCHPAAHGMPEEHAVPVAELIAEVLDGRNAYLADGVQRALGRAPRDFADYARDTAAAGTWNREGVAP